MASHRIGELLNHGDKLAQFRGQYIDYNQKENRAYVVLRLAVSRTALADEQGEIPGLTRLIGYVPTGNDWSGWVHVGSSYSGVYVDTNGWDSIEDRREIRKPRDSFRYTYIWHQNGPYLGEWRKQLWDRRCEDCSDYHNPNNKCRR